MAVRLISNPAYLNILPWIPAPKRSPPRFRFLTTLDNTSTSVARGICKYTVRRTPSNELPIYHLSKNGGNKKLTKIRKIEGDRLALRDELRTALQLSDKECSVNHLTGHILLKVCRAYFDIIKYKYNT